MPLARSKLIQSFQTAARDLLESVKIKFSSVPMMATQEVDAKSSCLDGQPVAKMIKLEDTQNESKSSVDQIVKSFISRPRVTESTVGIRLFLGDHKGFSGLLKNRFEDFVVREIDPSGHILRVTDVTPPKVDTEEPGLPLKQMIQEDLFDRIINFCSDKKSTDDIKIDVTDMEKEQRADVHRAIRAQCPIVESETLNEEGKRYIRIIRRGQSNRRQFQNSVRVWPVNKGDYVHFNLYKVNRDTFGAISLIAARLFIKPRYFSFAGSKDKRAVTCQRVAVRRIAPDKIVKACKDVIPPIIIGNFSFENRHLRLGDLTGNRFEFVLRAVHADSDEDIEQSLQNIEKIGFVNYYGMQRFGSTELPSHYIGLALLRQQWEVAVKLILSPRDIDCVPKKPGAKTLHESLRQYAESGDPVKTFKEMYYKSSLEGRVLKTLSRPGQSKNFSTAITCLSRPTRTLYGHAYQSYIWNKAATHRITTYGFKVVPGDLVLSAEVSDEMEPSEIPDDIDSELPEEDKNESEAHVTVDVPKRAKPVLVDDSNVSQFTIYDVVLPLPGKDVILPTNLIGKFIEDLMAEEDFNLDTFAASSSVNGLWGGYRKLIERARDVQWEKTTYKNPNAPLIKTEKDTLLPLPLPSDEGDQEKEKEEHKAVIVKLTLPKSCYATMAFREMLKRDDCICYQVQH